MKNPDSISLTIKLSYTETDSTLKYNLVLDSSIVLNHFSFEKENITEYNRLLHLPNRHELFSILDYIYVPAKKKLYILLDEWGNIRLYQYEIDISTKIIDKQKTITKPILLYKQESIDFKLLYLQNLCIKYVNDYIVLMCRFPFSSDVSFIKIPTNEYQQPVLLKPIKSTVYESDILEIPDNIIYINPKETDSIASIVEKKIKNTPYFSKSYIYLFNMENCKYPTRTDIKGKAIYKDDRFFFAKSNEKKILIQYAVRHWIFYEYEEISIDPNELINVSNS